MGEIDFFVWCLDHGETEVDGQLVRASCAIEAAKGWAEHKASRDSEYVKTFIDHGADVLVLERDTASPVRVHVRGNPDVYYTATAQP